MATIEAILAIAGPLVSNIFSLVTSAITASKTNDQATLDALHTQMLAAADALRPAGTAAV